MDAVESFRDSPAQSRPAIAQVKVERTPHPSCISKGWKEVSAEMLEGQPCLVRSGAKMQAKERSEDVDCISNIGGRFGGVED